MCTPSEFSVFVNSMRQHRVLHVGHRDADCDAVAAAYAVRSILPGDIGFAQGLKPSAQDLVNWLDCSPIIDPDPTEYEYTIVYDTPSLGLLGLPLPTRYALFDHHVPGGHRYSNLKSELAESAEQVWVRPVEATSALVVDLFQEANFDLDRNAAIALVCGIVTDTAWLQLASGPTFERLSYLLNQAGVTLGEALAPIDGANQSATRRSAVLAALRNVQEIGVGRYAILSTFTDSHEHGFAVLAALARLGGDIRLVAFPKDGQSMVMVEGDSWLVEKRAMDFSALTAGVAAEISAASYWGSAIWGRVVAPMKMDQLLKRCLKAVRKALAP